MIKEFCETCYRRSPHVTFDAGKLRSIGIPISPHLDRIGVYLHSPLFSPTKGSWLSNELVVTEVQTYLKSH